ncbi:MAG: hypothetical protein EXR63_02540 [Dehalococcoidia bacterium]|nr:hypothetical protein [Dehalococcoidia bacterium]
MPERIALQRSVATIGEASIVVQPSRAQLGGALTELAIAGGAIVLIVALFDRLPLVVLVALLLLAVVIGPVGMLGVVYNVAGTSFLLDRVKRSARWQQGFLGMGIGTTEFVPFDRIARIEVRGDAAERLASGERQDVAQWTVLLVKDNGRELTIGTVVAPGALAAEGLDRANHLAGAIAAMAGATVQLAALPAPEGERAAATTPAGRRRRRRRVPRAAPPPPAPGT